jgi:1A family penicillin-binding protein
VATNTLQQIQNKYIPKVLDFLQDVGKISAGTILSITTISSSVVAGGLVGLAISFRNLPDVRVLRHYVPTETSYIYDIEGNQIASLHSEANREVVPLSKISPTLKRAVLAIEDSHFYQHQGINPSSVARAFLTNVEQGEVVEGGSTLTMQLVKNLFLSPEREFSRKVAEAVLAIRLEQILSKDEILELYLNQVYWGHNTYGAETAAQSYFDKSVSELNLAEASMMAGLIAAPEEYSPFVDMEAAKQRQQLVLQRMQELNWITAKKAQAALKKDLQLGHIDSFETSREPYVTEAVVEELKERFGQDLVLKGGMRVQTTVDLQMQALAEQTVQKWYNRWRRRGLYPYPSEGQLALVAVDPRTHFVKAIVGGVDYEESQFNRALQAQRQPGSSFKPFVYYTAFASGKYAPSTPVRDTPTTYKIGTEVYKPRNYGGSFMGTISVRKALKLSRNVPAVRIGQNVGLNEVIEVTRRLGIKSPMEPVFSLPLGSNGVTPMEMAGAFATFANNGWHSETTLIVQVTDSSGQVLLDNTPQPQLVLDPWATATLTDILKDVIEEGTGTKAQLDRPAAGKTGTTSSQRDVWFVGYVPQLATAVWIGHDNNYPLAGSATGGSYAAPVWQDFMKQALSGKPVKKFPNPSQFDRP